jgi:hypothetical protein
VKAPSIPQNLAVSLSSATSDICALALSTVQEALNAQFRDHLIRGPHYNLQRQQRMAPRPISATELLSKCRTTINSWAEMAKKSENDEDQLLIEIVKPLTKEWCDSEKEEIDIKLLIVDSLWEELLVDTTHALCSTVNA